MRGIVIRTCVVAALALASALYAPEAHAQASVVYDPTNFFQNFSNHSETIGKYIDQLTVTEEQLNQLFLNNDLLDKVYSLNDLLGGSVEVVEYLGMIKNYESMLSSAIENIDYYASNGISSPRDVLRAADMLNDLIGQTARDAQRITGQVMKWKGMTPAERTEALRQAKNDLKERMTETWVLWEKTVSEPKQQYMGSVVEATAQSALTPFPLHDYSTLKNRSITSTSSVNEAALNDPYVNKIYEAAQKVKRASLDDVKASRSGYRHAVDLVTAVVAILASLFFALAYWRRNKGDHQSHDALLKVFVGVLFFMTALQIVLRVFQF